MTPVDMAKAARDATNRARSYYGKGWRLASQDARRGAIALCVCSDFEAFGKSQDVTTLLAVMRLAWDMGEQ